MVTVSAQIVERHTRAVVVRVGVFAREVVVPLSYADISPAEGGRVTITMEREQAREIGLTR